MMIFNGFKKEALTFLDEIKENNNKEWFENNRIRWQELILEPNINYVHELGEHLIALAPMIRAIPKVSGSLFRIYRDVRFSNDKTPIKTKIGVLFWQGSAHRMQCACFYMQYTSTEVLLGTGLRVFKTPLLKSYREYVKVEKNAKALHEIIVKYKAMGYEIKEPKYKRLPVGFDRNNPYSYLSLYDGIFVYTTFKPNKTFFSKNIINKNFKFYDATHELFDWIYEFTLYAKEN